MATWRDFETQAPDLAQFGLEMLTRYGLPMAFFATVQPDGAPRVHPVSPILAERRLFISVARGSPKAEDLRSEPRYMLHAFPAEGNLEFSVRGHATEVLDDETRSLVIDAIEFMTFDPADPIFELEIERADSTRWEQ